MFRSFGANVTQSPLVQSLSDEQRAPTSPGFGGVPELDVQADAAAESERRNAVPRWSTGEE
jgi:hypothetical protein